MADAAGAGVSSDLRTRVACPPRPRPQRPRFVTSLALNVVAFGFLWIAYSTIRMFTADSFRRALDNAHSLLRFQHWVGLPSEATAQSMFLDYEWLVRGANVYYLGMHFPSMIVFLLAVMVWKRHWMPRVRLALIGSTAAGLVIHLAFPLAPPRMLAFDGFVDTAKIFGPDPYSLGIAEAANEFAAMPSMHVGWALLIALAVVRMSSSRLRWIVVAHPIITTAVVVVTANHYWSDVVVGALLGLMGWWIAGFFRFVDERADSLDGHVVDLVAAPAEPDHEPASVPGRDRALLEHSA